MPTSCRKQGKCKECMVEVVEGMELLSAPTEAEQHLKGKFRLSCQTQVTAASGESRCHTMRRGHMRIERHAFGLPVSGGAIRLDPAVTRDGDRILMDGVEVDRCERADSWAGDGSGYDDGGGAAAGSGDRRADCGHFVRESAAVWRRGSDVAHCVRH